MPAPEQLDFESLAPLDRTVLYVGEVAFRWRISENHVIDLLEEGKLAGFDITGSRKEFIRIPAAAVEALAKHFKVPREVVMTIITAATPERKTSRANWRIPVEGYCGFIQENRS